MFAIQIKVSPTCSPVQPAGSLAQAKFWQRSYISCVENREETALVFRDFAGTTHTPSETIPPASQAAYKFSLYFIILFYLSAVKEYSFLPIHFFKKFIYCFPKLCLQCTLSFHERQKTFFASELITRLTVTNQSSERAVITIMGNTVIKRHFDCLWYNDWQVSAPSSPLPS